MKKHVSAAFRPLASLNKAAICVIGLGAGVMPASAANLTRSIEVSGAAAEVWSVIGPFCAIKDCCRRSACASRTANRRRPERS